MAVASYITLRVLGNGAMIDSLDDLIGVGVDGNRERKTNEGRKLTTKTELHKKDLLSYNPVSNYLSGKKAVVFVNEAGNLVH
jgi:hypothetical protein